MILFLFWQQLTMFEKDTLLWIVLDSLENIFKVESGDNGQERQKIKGLFYNIEASNFAPVWIFKYITMKSRYRFLIVFEKLFIKLVTWAWN